MRVSVFTALAAATMMAGCSDRQSVSSFSPTSPTVVTPSTPTPPVPPAPPVVSAQADAFCQWSRQAVVCETQELDQDFIAVKFINRASDRRAVVLVSFCKHGPQPANQRKSDGSGVVWLEPMGEIVLRVGRPHNNASQVYAYVGNETTPPFSPDVLLGTISRDGPYCTEGGVDSGGDGNNSGSGNGSGGSGSGSGSGENGSGSNPGGGNPNSPGSPGNSGGSGGDTGGSGCSKPGQPFPDKARPECPPGHGGTPPGKPAK